MAFRDWKTKRALKKENNELHYDIKYFRKDIAELNETIAVYESIINAYKRKGAEIETHVKVLNLNATA